MGSIPGLGRFHMLPSSSAHVPQKLNPGAPEPVLCNKRSRRSEKPSHCSEE